ncbi:polysaccharide biosynthesis/export family protein [Kaistella jeonii]|uniref:Sugar transporter n=1 Tax=Kaistella jeonii TaxID=266749 RepID=A0A0C1FKR7_9FLAO|nr:polysaccharide biosynthesis/export family protein [Kaistella jeonii]KIA88534.1 sugar transporter [Kaistella jeonii]SFC20238.1 polysaccharide export outer membrane protein [Kaistella jeonii]VEI96997.1 polysaccharide export protein Wza [Kaistella jeonii]
MKKYFPVFTAIITILLLFSCKPKKNIIYLSNNNFEQEVSQAKYSGLHIQEGDKLQILVSAFDDIAVRPFNMSTVTTTTTAGAVGSSGSSGTNDYIVTTDGTIIFPVLGSIFCKGMTKQQLKADLESRLKRYLTDPMVTITLSNFNFSVLGEVGSPGQKTSPSEKLNILQAMALSGDIKYEGNKTNVKLIRYSEEEAKDKVISLDLSEVSIVNSPYYYLQQNDILYVEPDRNKQVSVNTSSNVDNWIRYGGIGLGLLTLIFTLTRK